MKTRFRKITAYLLTLCMLMTLLPAGTLTAFATEETEHNHDEGVSVACTCGTEDESIHATDCPAYVAPETAVCTCVEQCTEDNANVWCDVCGFDASACTGTDTAVAYADSLTVTIGTGESVTLNDTDGDGYYEIGTADELYAFAALVNGGKYSINGKLTANITVNENVLKADGTLNGDGTNFRAWTPIDNIGMYFGTFDGDNKTISGLYFSDTNSYAAGLFGYVGWDESADVCGTVKNVGVVNSYFSGKENVGGVVGNMPYGGAVENCYSSASVSGGNCVGGVVGYSRGTVRNCYNTGSVSGTGNYVGGVVGQNDGTVENCYNTGTVNGSQNVGGVIGTNRGTVENCYNTGSVSGTYYIGGVAGSNQSNAEVKNCYNTGTVSGTSDTGGVLGINNSGTVTNCYYLKDCATDGSGVAQQGIGAATQGSATEDVEDGTVTTGYYDFSTGEVCYKLNGDQSNIVFKQTIGTGTPTFTGSTVYYGYTSCLDEVMAYTNEVASDELKHNWENGRCMNDCGYTHTPHTWSDGICSECLLTCTHSAGWANGVCTTCGAAHDPHSYTNGFCIVCGGYQPAVKVDADNYKELGFTAENYEGYLKYYAIGNAGQLYWFADWVNGKDPSANAVLTADITVNSNVLTVEGALAADTSSFKDWTPIGDATNTYSGIFDGQGHTISGLYFSNESTDYVGLFGWVQNGTVKNVGVVDSYFCGQNYVGGVVGQCEAYNEAYNSKSASVENCYNTGTVSGSAYYVGGVVGYLYSIEEGSTASVKNCYNTGNVSGISSNGSTYVGGVVGQNYGYDSGTATVANCYNTGSVSGSTNSKYVGGVAGDNYASNNGTATIENCYYLTNCATDGDGKTQFGIGAAVRNTATEDDVSGKVTAAKDKDTFKSGAVAYLLNGDDAGTDAGVWKQTLDTDDSPNFTGKTVYQSGTGYTNHEHNWSYEDGAYAYQIYATCTAEGCTLTGRVTIILGALGGTYTGDAHTASVLADSSEFTVREDAISYTKDGTALSAGEVPTDAGIYKATLKLGNAEASVEYTIEQAPLTITAATIDSKTYDGTKTAVIDSVTLDGTKNSESLILGTDYEATAVFDNADAGDNKTVNVTVTLKDTPKAKNYTLSSGTYSLTGQTISKASLTPTSGNLEVTNGRAGSYTFSLSNLLPTLGDGQTYGDVTYTLGTVTLNESYYDSDTVSISGSILTLPIKAVESSTESEVGTIQITITSDNYTFTEATITVSAVNKEVPQGEPTLSKTTLTYGDKLSTITLSGSMTDTNGNPVTGTFTWENPDAVPTVATTSVTWKFTPENSDAYAEVTGTANIVVNKAASSVSTAPTGDADLTYTGSGQNLLSDKGTAQGGEMQFSLEQNGNYSADIPTGTNAGDYTVWYKVVGDANHKDTAPLSLSVNIKGAAPVIGWQKDSDRKTYDGSAATLLVQATVTLVNNETYAETTHGSLSYTWYTDANCTVKTGTMDNSGASGEGMAPVNAGTYYVKASLAAKGNYAAADSSALTYTIDKNTDTTAPALGVGYTIDYVNESITIASGYSVKSDFDKSSAATVNSGSISSYIGTAAAPGILYIQRAADQNHVASAWAEISLSRPAAPTGLVMSAETIQGVTDAMEYSVDGGTTWTAVPAGQTQITGLTGNTTVQVRFKATDSAFCSELITNPTCTAPTGLTATYGDLLSSVALTNPDGNTPGEWKWTDSDPNTTVGDAGDKAISATFTPADGNYMTKIVAVTVTVSPVEVTVTADAKSKTYGEDNPALTYKVSGLIGQDTLSGSLATTATKMSNVGEYDITIGDLANSNYTISYTGAKLTITKAASSVTIAPVAVSNLTYKGGEQDLITAGTADGGTMQYSLDDSTWSPAIPTGTNAGSYTVYYKVVSDINHEDTAVKSVSVTIAPKVVTNPVIEGIDARYLHTGEAIQPVPTAVKDGETIIDSGEYNVSWENNTNVGTANVKIEDNNGGNYTVSGSKTFEIVTHEHDWKYTVSDNVITATCESTFGDCPVTSNTVTITLKAPASLTYDGSAKVVTVEQSPAGVFTDIPDVTYTGDRMNVTADGFTATLNYGGETAEISFTITKASIQGAKIEVSGTYTYNKQEQKPTTLTVTLDGKTLAENDYEITGYSNNIDAGDATITIEGKGNYSGTATGNFGIAKAKITSPDNTPYDYKLTKYHTDVSSAIAELQERFPTVTYGTEIGQLFVEIEWSCKEDTYDPTLSETHEFLWRVKDGQLDNYDNYMGIGVNGDVTITNVSGIPVTHTGEDATIDYDGNTYDVSQMFTIDENAGEASYEIVTVASTGAGTLEGSVLTITKVGTIKIRLSTSGNGLYATGDTTATLTVNKGTQKIEVSIDGWTYGDEPSAPTSSGIGEVTYVYTDEHGIERQSVPTEAGNWTVIANYSGNDLYNGGSNYTNFVIAQKEITPTISGSAIKDYDGTTNVPEAHNLSITLSGVLDADKNDVSAAATYAYDGTDVGTTTIKATDITLSGDKAKNYELTATTVSADSGTITKVESTCTPPDDIDTLVFNGSEQALITAGTAIGGEMQYKLGSDGTWGTEIPKGKNAGNYKVFYRVVGDKNHEDDSGGSVVVIIKQAAAPTVTIDKQSFIRTIATMGNTIDVAAMLPDDRGETSCADLDLSGVAGIVSEDLTFLTPSGSLTFGTMTSETVKSGKITFVVIMENYANTTVEVEVELFDKTTLTVTGVEALTELVYNGEGQIGYAGTPAAEDYDGQFAVTYSGRNGTTFEGDAENPPKNAGDYTVTLAIPDEDLHYKGQISVDFTIGKAGLVIKADDKSAYRNASAPEYTYTVTGLIGEDTLTTAPTLTCDTDMKTNGTFDIVASGADAGNNYTIEYTKGTLTVRTRSSGGSSSSTTTTTTKNDDGSTTKTTTNKATGTVTEVTTNPDGSTTTVETKKDGTVTTTEKDADGNTTTTVENPDGSSVTTEKNKDGSETVIEKDTEGTTTTTEKDSEGNTTVTTEKADGTTTTEETKADGTKVLTETTGSGKTTATISAKAETEVVIPVPDTDKVRMIVVTDEDGKDTYITDIKAEENGVAVTTSGDATVSVISGDKKEFVDVHPVEHWSEESIDFVHALGLMNGTSENHFSPDEKLTRAMLVTVLYRAEGEPEIANDASFTDVESGSYYEKAVAWAKANGIVNGTTETTFAPNDNITREQIAAIMHRYADYKGHDVSVGENTNILSYDDAHHVSEYAIGAMQYAVGTGLIKGKTDSTLNPSDNATRAEAAAIIERYIKAN